MPLDIARQYMAQLAGTSAGQLAGSILNDHSRGLDPFEAAALRQRMGVRPDGGRKETTPGELDPITQTASDVLIPKSPLDLAMMALSGPFRLGTKVAALAAGGVLSSDEAHAGPLGAARKALAVGANIARKTERFEWPVRTEYGTNITMPITVNPSARDIAKELANAPHGDVRALKAPNGDVYLWPANEAMHRDIASTFDMPFKTRQDLQKSSYLFNSKDVDALGGFKSFDDLITRLGSQ